MTREEWLADRIRHLERVAAGDDSQASVPDFAASPRPSARHRPVTHCHRCGRRLRARPACRRGHYTVPPHLIRGTPCPGAGRHARKVTP